ncbi:hypothetical protein D3C81_1894460 [compost metagenome]
MLVPFHEERPRAAGDAAHVQHLQSVGDGDDGAGFACAAAQVQIFGMQAVAVVPATQPHEQAARHQQQCAGQRLHLLQRR